MGDFVWLDTNEDGLQTPGEPGVAGVTVQLLSGTTVAAQTMTDAAGWYWFAGVTPGQYRLQFVSPDPYQFYFPGQITTSNPDADNDADDTGLTAAFGLVAGGADPKKDAALVNFKIQLIGDTDRDGTIDDTKDLPGKTTWTNALGAIYAVNHDDSADPLDAIAADRIPDGKPDAVDFGDDGFLTGENLLIENAADAKQLAPLRVKYPGKLPANTKLVISVANLDQATAIHLFDKREKGANWLLGGAGVLRQGIGPGIVNPELQSKILPDQAKNVNLELGLEGLVYRYQGPNAPAPLEFNGFIELTLQMWDTTGAGQVVPNAPTSKVKMKVAPWMMMSNAQASEKVYAVEATNAAGHKPDNDALRAAFATTTQLVAYKAESVADPAGNLVALNRWAQDHAEVGYTQQPGGDPIWATFQLPYLKKAGVVQPEWVKKELLKNKMGVFQLGDTLPGGGGGDFGGNVELMPPDTKHPLGVIVVGDTISPALKDFFNSQEAQTVREVTQPTTAIVGEVLVLPTKWLLVGHVDEMLSFDKSAGKVFFADPEATYTMLKTKLTAAEQDAGLFFATGKTQAGAVNVEVVAAPEKDYRIETPNIDHTLPATPKFKYIRIVSGAAKGQIAEIVNWQKDFVEVGDVWNTTSNLVYDKDGAAGAVTKIYSKEVDKPAAKQNKKWFVKPAAGDKFILMVDSKMSLKGNPVAFSLREMLADPNFEAVNSAALVAGQIDLARKLIKAVSPTMNFVSVPTLYFGQRTVVAPGPEYVLKGDAFNPGLGNFQIVGGKYFVPQPFAPKYANGKDLFEEEVKGVLGAADVVFVDDWSYYHLYIGEVHCGTLVQREVLPVVCWKKLIATP